MSHPLLTTAIKYLFFSCLLVIVLYFGKPFMVPLAFAGLMAMLVTPLVRKLKGWGWNDGLAAFLIVFVFGAIILGALYFLIDQLASLSQQSDEIEKSFKTKSEELKTWVSNHFGVSKSEQDKFLKEQQGSADGSKIMMAAAGVLKGLGGFLTNLILMLVYMFLLIFYRGHIADFVVKVIPERSRVTLQVLEEMRTVAQKYIVGMGAMIACLWVMYGIGFSIVGVKNGILFAILCGLLEIVPFVGNLTGTAITLIATLLQGGSTGMVIGVLVTYGTVQFLQTYLLEPLIVGEGVSLNPLFTIGGIVAGELIWGIPGMILAIPVLGIIKIIFDHVDSLKPYGVLMGTKPKKASKRP